MVEAFPPRAGNLTLPWGQAQAHQGSHLCPRKLAGDAVGHITCPVSAAQAVHIDPAPSRQEKQMGDKQGHRRVLI